MNKIFVVFRKNALENRYRVEMYVVSPTLQGQLIARKIRSITSVVLVIKKLWGILDFFFTQTRLFTAQYPAVCIKKKFYKEFLNYYSLKSQNFTVIVTKIRMLGQKKTKGEGSQTPPPPAC